MCQATRVRRCTRGAVGVFFSFSYQSLLFLPKPRLVSTKHSVGSVAPPSISSASYCDHDSLLRTPRRFREAGCPLKRSASACDHGMTRAALHASDRTPRVQFCVRFIFPQHPVYILTANLRATMTLAGTECFFAFSRP